MTPSELLQKLIRFNTSNPPGKEKECILWIKELLDKAGFITALFAKDPNRPNLVARLKGRGDAPPFFLYGHVDVVPATDQKWAFDPFKGVSSDGCIWGRGALDMKSGIAMMLYAVLKIKNEEIPPSGDIVFAALCDEEAGSDFGANFMVSEHPEQFEGIKYALGEFGGFPLSIGKKTFYPIQTGEKQSCWMRAKISGPGGHGSQHVTGSAMAKLGTIISNLDKKSLPVHITPIVREMILKISNELSLPAGFILKGVLHPLLTDHMLNVSGDFGKMFAPILHNTVNVTMVKGGDKVNVVPSEINIEMDGRILPGFNSKQFIKEINRVAGRELSIEVMRNDSCPPEPDMGLFDTLTGVLKKAHPGSVPIPFLLAGSTDARFFSRLGIQTYGFLPMNLPADFNFTRLIHAEDERIPEHCLQFGADAIYEVAKRYSLTKTSQ